MKALSLFFFLSANIAYAGMCPCEFGGHDKPRRHELGLSIFNTFGEPGNYRLRKKVIIPQILNGFHYKYHSNLLSFRMQGFYRRFRINDERFFETIQGRSMYYELRAGLEKSFYNKGAFRIYAGLDGIYGYGENYGNQMRWRTGSGVENYATTVAYKGISGILGLNYRISKTISMSLEPAYNVTKNTQKGNLGNTNYRKSYFLLNNLSVNFHF